MNTYIHPGDKERWISNWVNLRDNIKEILDDDPKAQIIIAGDFNVNLFNFDNKFCKIEWELIKKILINVSIKSVDDWSFKHRWIEKESKSLVDFFLFYNIDNEIKIEEEEGSWPLSDHKLIKAVVNLKLLKTKNTKIFEIPNKALPAKVKQHVLEGNCINLQSHWQIVWKNMKLANKSTFKFKKKPVKLLQA